MTKNRPADALPDFEANYLRLFLNVGTGFFSDRSITASLNQAAIDILQVTEQNDVGVLSQTYTIPRLTGIEEASCDWSILMVIDHLSLVNHCALQIIRELKSNNLPFVSFKSNELWPNLDAYLDSIDRYREITNRYLSFAKSHQSLRTPLTALHPQFGELNGHQWHYHVSRYQKFRLRQIYKILAMIGVA